LLSLIFIAIITLTFIAFNAQQKTKDQITGQYFGSLIPIKDLQQIVIILNKDVTLRTFLARIYQDDQTFSKELQQHNDQIKQLWKEYATHWKSEEERPYIAYVDALMSKLYDYLDELSRLSVQMYAKESKISLDSLRKTIEHVESHLNNLIGHEVNSAHSNRLEFLAGHKKETLIYGLVALFILMATLYLFIIIQTNHAKLYQTSEALHRESITDGLTGLFNRRYFDQIFPTELKRAKREHQQVAFMMLDIDHFKKYNDTYGHQAGDDAIQAVAQHLHHYFKRTGDLIFRLGGEEFGVFMHSQKFEAIEQLCKEMLQGMEKLNIEHKSSDVKSYLTLSVGVTFISKIEDDIDIKKLYKQTDAQLYTSKESGRNQATIQEVNF
ncbi:MAG: diguanylate cyclase, partial [Thiovulaceae bacterium]|nr:diguanylate cyclase [Sulfurimonadaceae bacterium]